MNSWPDIAIPPIDQKFFFPPLSIFDSATKKLSELPVKDTYRIYVCGITPYDATHLGHAATYLTFDLVNRYLRAMGKSVIFVENVTDIDDPLLERAKRDGVDWEDLAHSQIELFRGDMTALRVIPPDSYIGAVESIPLVISAVESMMKSGVVYDLEGDKYFATESDPAFGSRSHLSREDMLTISAQRGGDPLRPGKQDPLDALVWMAKRPGEPSWSSPFGEGRPGWHIECCAIALEYLHPDPKESFLIDIQGGGNDLIFPHHDIGASQAFALGKKPYSRNYMHAGMIGLHGEKMSKSLGNLLFLSTMILEGIDPMAIKVALINRRYSQDYMWNDDALAQAQDLIGRLRLLLSRPEVPPTDLIIEEIIAHLSNDLDTPAVFAALKRWCDQSETGGIGGSPGELSRALDTLLGISF
ncbi:MAG: cysteine--1-D-myo-inosityl 2-amino-2-deoxy-alpha-D-glucopyranoside ligase [Actinobacteria bacterium]|uniref:L-cysteine:1D-myo-inositol 2-amino-2-deoxy-alpha-D-glucopyranoside ligase n=1 Tax=freshwater metagenome TaxID=449393 RepID=A0A6J6MCF0_9ZZZZ|nr:cysteine--1-D-myo-inosityl 2-amino-2-deoxy-alpha-D-glucopyranoside ligase [Actinomycetota bacterium]MSX24549.1 cysteine--1-D-myo-inosityl 2-amino-2-deoxy-alpha-D-glucopyranoside ligase [Actinomycetota bacterium]MSY46946.1 cysteine--1-D-myo-inosityl 2-amino-2-deoxy-alpha-D-glucopyranoside ligase [Actinomycetota bacterium]MTB00233.1 cysteine--1-D-myo-inosityl 2-amino-2-deoxy-alpha-D-glucopyranoside ligase [Actinomycetota bacterium]